MLPISEQLAQGRLVCPRSHRPLRLAGEALRTAGGELCYEMVGGVPILLPGHGPDPEGGPASGGKAERLSPMAEEYGRSRPPSRALAAVDHFVRARGDQRSQASRAAFGAVIAQADDGALCLSIGGGPTRAHPRLVNLNIDRFANVDIVGTAYALPYADGAVDAIHVEAVLEHLEFPGRAVEEMFRVLRSGGEVFAATPFLQGFHGYPSHYQNFTRVGHDRLFERAGFEVVVSGACVGPTYALSDLASLYFRHYLPGRILSRGAQRAVTLASLLVRPLDRRLHRRPESELLASSVFARLRKPRGC